MRIALLIIALIATSLFAASTIPSVERSAAVFTGKVLSAQRVRVVGKDESSRWELWKAEVSVQALVTQDVALARQVFVYYAQNWSTNYINADGSHTYFSGIAGCPGRPSIATNYVYKFFCIRSDVDHYKQLLFVPEGGWVIRQ